MHAATSSLLLACPTGSRVASSRRAPRHARVRAAASSAASSTSSSTPARLEGEALESYTKKMAEDLTHLFDETGIDRELYESDVSFEDPLTKYDNIDGYLFNINMLKNVFTPVYTMHTIEQTGDWELSTRWTMEMNLPPVPFVWRPKLTFTGTSVMGINPATMKVRTHFDTWDAIDTQGFFLKSRSPEGVREVFTQIFDFTKQPDLETPTYQVLRRFADYEIREYRPFLVAETRTAAEGASRAAAGGMTGGGDGSNFNPFGTLAGYIFGQGNATGEKFAMTTPVFTSPGKMQFVLPSKYTDPSQLPPPKDGVPVNVTKVDGGVYAALRFSGIATDAASTDAENALLDAIKKDGLARAGGVASSLAQYNDPATPPPQRRNDVLVRLEGFDRSKLDLPEGIRSLARS